MRNSRSRMPSRLRPNGDRTSMYNRIRLAAKKAKTKKKNVISLVRSSPKEGRLTTLMPLSPPVSEFQQAGIMADQHQGVGGFGAVLDDTENVMRRGVVEPFRRYGSRRPLERGGGIFPGLLGARRG